LLLVSLDTLLRWFGSVYNMDLPPVNESYKDLNYWNERYKTEENYDWFKTYKDFVHLLEGHVSRSDWILMLGKKNKIYVYSWHNE
jgi:hypothetical protein